MKEDYVSFKLAILLEKKGFPQHTTTHTYFVGDDKQRGCAVGDFIGHPSEETDTHLIDAPTHQMVLKWLREVHKIIISFNASFVNSIEQHFSWNIRINSLKSLNDEEHFEPIYINTKSEVFEEACETAFKYCSTNLI